MAGEKSGDSKLFQLVTLLVTSIIAPITVYFATNAINKANNPPPTPVPTVVQQASVDATQAQPGGETPLQATLTFTPEAAPAETLLPTAEPTATLPPTAEPTATATVAPADTATVVPPTATSYGIQNPSGVIPSGSPVVVGDLALIVDQKDVALDGGYVMVTLHVRNMGDKKQVFRYTAQSITIRDSRGKLLEPFNGDKKPACKPTSLQDKKEISIDRNKEVKVHSVAMKDLGKWCGRNSNDLLPIYAGPISEDAEALLIEFDGFGPFSGFTIEVKLK